MLNEEQRARHAIPADNTSNEERLSIDRISIALKYNPDVFKNKFIADMGCGYGTITNHLCKDSRVIGIDINDKALEIARPRHKHLSFVKGYIFEPIFKDKLFDMIVCVEVLEHIDLEELNLTLKEWKRIIKDDGLIYITTPERGNDISTYPNGSHYIEYKHDEFINIVQKHGFKLVWTLKNSGNENTMAFLFGIDKSEKAE